MFAVITDRTWLWAAAGCYFAGLAFGTIALLRRGRPAGVATYALVAIGYALQLAGLTVRGRAVGGCPLGNPFELLQFTAWSATTLYLIVGVAFRHSLLGYLTAALAAALTLVSLAVPAWDATHRTPIFGPNPWIELHAALAVFSYGVFGLLALTSVMFLLRHRTLKAKETGWWSAILPPIRDLDLIGVRLLGTGAVILTAALAVIVLFFAREPAAVSVAKFAATSLVWLASVATLALRLRGRLIAQRFAVLGVALFVAALLSLVPVDGSRPAAPPLPEARTP
ncbi:MAG: cytochrome c biogenesis protein CcsA [Opitutaceae bacterium]|nr:cytochrome c biogenesis protein CcsA [Opitutaceae bacterium]